MPPLGLERTAETHVNDSTGEQGGAESDALGANEAPLDDELAAVVDAWPALPAAIKVGIMAMVRAPK